MSFAKNVLKNGSRRDPENALTATGLLEIMTICTSLSDVLIFYYFILIFLFHFLHFFPSERSFEGEVGFVYNIYSTSHTFFSFCSLMPCFVILVRPRFTSERVMGGVSLRFLSRIGNSDGQEFGFSYSTWGSNAISLFLCTRTEVTVDASYTVSGVLFSCLFLLFFSSLIFFSWIPTLVSEQHLVGQRRRSIAHCRNNKSWAKRTMNLLIGFLLDKSMHIFNNTDTKKRALHELNIRL